MCQACATLGAHGATSLRRPHVDVPRDGLPEMVLMERQDKGPHRYGWLSALQCKTPAPGATTRPLWAAFSTHNAYCIVG
jgi:hypothetical protein